ncbi:MAG: glycosyltransferase family 39 protein [Anaerolineae bacterium]|nr:glycosyltransferase family 39 protein [Anaerolineae bacterium]
MATSRLSLALLILLLAAGLRITAMENDQRFHPDEALFASFARNAAVQGDWLLHGALDKTPLSIYMAALGMTAFGVTALPNGVLTLDTFHGEFAARLPNVYASILFVALMMALARRAFRQARAAILTGILAAISPLALAFSAVAFTDPLMLVCITAAFYAALRGKPVQTGIWLALGIGCKQQAVLYTPLLLAVLWRSNMLHPEVVGKNQDTQEGKAGSAAKYLRDSILMALPVAVGLTALLVWDEARGQVTGLWTLAAANNDPGRLAHPDELLPRLVAWMCYAQYLLPLTPIAVLIGLRILTAATRITSHSDAKAASQQRRAGFMWILAAYAVLYLLAHWAVAVNIYDRYLLPLLPVAILLAAGVLSESGHKDRQHNSVLLTRPFVASTLFLLALSLPTALDALAARLPIGGDRGKHQGIEDLAAHLEGKPLGTIIYDHWLGWELGYYMGTWSDKRRVYYPTPHALAADAPLNPDCAPRYIAAPADVTLTPWLNALRRVGFTISLDYAHGRFVSYRLIPALTVKCASTAESS